MDTTRMISFIIPVRDRDKKRIKNCVNSLKSDITKEIIIIDYGSKKILKDIPGTKIIRYNKNKIWNKAHAINIGIRASKCDYIGTVDCDMIISPYFLDIVKRHINYNSFIYSLNVKRIEPECISTDFKAMLDKSTGWFREISRNRINHTANGGIQIYPKKWITDIGGCDESLIYWGAIDNDTFERAVMCGLSMVNINIPILHQEHKKKKEENLPEKEKSYAFHIRIEKVKYLDKMFKMNKYIRNSGKWGLDKPNQNRFLRNRLKYERDAGERKRLEVEYRKEFMKAVSGGKKYFMFNGKKITLFKGAEKPKGL